MVSVNSIFANSLSGILYFFKKSIFAWQSDDPANPAFCCCGRFPMLFTIDPGFRLPKLRSWQGVFRNPKTVSEFNVSATLISLVFLSSSAIWPNCLCNSCIFGVQKSALPEAWKCDHSATDSDHSVDLCQLFNGLWPSSWCVSDSPVVHFPTRLSVGSDFGVQNIMRIWTHGKDPEKLFHKPTSPPFLTHSLSCIRSCNHRPSFITHPASHSYSLLLTTTHYFAQSLTHSVTDSLI